MELVRTVVKINIFILVVSTHFFLWAAAFKYFTFLS